MLGEVNSIDGIGAEIAPNIQCLSTKKPLWNLLPTYVNNAKQNKKTEIAIV
jgi:hypothetical protein